MAIAIAAIPAFIASLVEFVEAYTIVLAIGVTRGWRAPLYGAAAALLTLGVLVLAFGVTLVNVIDEHAFQLLVGSLLLLFGLKWLRKAILRYAGIVPLHDEELIYQRQVAELRAQGREPDRFDCTPLDRAWREDTAIAPRSGGLPAAAPQPAQRSGRMGDLRIRVG